jgi:type VI protein secretion system component Hcp
MAEAVSGASRRDVLMGSAVGVGALVGGIALTNLGESSAEAATLNGHTDYVTIAGINPNNPIVLTSVSVGGSSRVAKMTMRTGTFSPKILQAFGTQTAISSVKIRDVHQNSTGQIVTDMLITLANVKITFYEVSVSNAEPPLDTVHMSYTGLSMTWTT